MSVSIMEALQCANINMQYMPSTGLAMLAKDQIRNAVTLLEKGYGLEEHVEPLLEEYGDVDKVPNK